MNSPLLKWAVCVSLLANVALAWWLWRPSPEGTRVSLPEVAADPAPVQWVTNTISTVHDVQSVAPAFDWALVESDDYEVYQANLRRLEVPEWLVRDLILAELQHQYRVRELQLAATGPNHWLTYREARQRRRERAEAAWALKREEHAVMRRFTGTYRHKEAADALGESRIAMAFGGMSADQALDTISTLLFVKEHGEYLDDLHNGLFSRDDEEEMLAAFAAAQADASSRISSAAFEEFYLRLHVALVGVLDRFDMPGLRLTGAQLRQLILLRARFIDPIRWELTEMDEPGDAELRALHEEVRTGLTFDLGPEVAVQYARSQDPAFRAIHELAGRHQLPVENAIASYEVRQATIDEVRRLITSEEVDELEKWEMRQFIQQEAETTLQSTLGREAWADYRANDGRWLDRVGGTPPGAEAGGGR